MKFFNNWLYNKVRDMWDNPHKYEINYEEHAPTKGHKMGMAIGASMVERSRPEGEDRISFELSSAVGGRILNVRRYDDRKDRHEQATYVIATGEDVGSRVAKILNLEMLK